MASSGSRDSCQRFLNGHDMRRSLIVNADELGLTEGINEGIIEVQRAATSVATELAPVGIGSKLGRGDRIAFRSAASILPLGLPHANHSISPPVAVRAAR